MNIVIILSGGTGTRLGGDIPKQYIEIDGKPVIGYCLDTFFAHPSVEAVQIVADDAWREYILNYIRKTEKRTGKSKVENSDKIESEVPAKWKGFSAPGQNRQLSIYHALQDCMGYASPDDYVMIHDAARPFVSDACIAVSFQEVREHDGILPVLPMKDTVYLSKDGKRISSLLNREQIFAGQAPETFHLGRYYEANRGLLPDRIKKINGSTEPAILAGLDGAMTEGDEGNFKITTKADLERFRQKLSGRNIPDKGKTSDRF